MDKMIFGVSGATILGCILGFLILVKIRNRKNARILIRAQEAQTFEQLRDVLRLSPNSTAGEIAQGKIDALKLTAEREEQESLDADPLRKAAAKYCCSYEGSPAGKTAKKEWDEYSLKEVLTANTLAELFRASERAREGSLAKRFVPFMHEEISHDEVTDADSVDEIIEAANMAPEGPALYISFTKLYPLFTKSEEA